MKDVERSESSLENIAALDKGIAYYFADSDSSSAGDINFCEA
jgi:hypothetical protein